MKRLPIGIQDDVNEVSFLLHLATERDAVRLRTPVRLPDFDAMPRFIRLPDQLGQAYALALVLHVPQEPSRIEERHEPMHICVFGDQRPVEPVDVVVMAVGVVVAALCTPHFVAHEDHGQTHGKQRDGQEVLHLPVPQLFDYRIVRRTLDAAVPASIVVGSVPVLFAVRFIVLAVVRDEVVEREPIVAGHEVDALLRFALLVSIHLRASDHAVGKARQRTLFTAEEAAGIVAEPPVPFFPTVPDEAAHLVEPGRIPRFGNKLHARH